jgi:hypothetical protein
MLHCMLNISQHLLVVLLITNSETNTLPHRKVWKVQFTVIHCKASLTHASETDVIGNTYIIMGTYNQYLPANLC